MPETPKLIVIIEDDAVLRRSLKLVFGEHDFAITTFADILGVFDNFAVRMPDVVLYDYKLPSTNGIEVLKQIRKIYKQTPFFLMTGYYKQELETSAKENGANAVFEKLLDIQALIDACRLAAQQRM